MAWKMASLSSGFLLLLLLCCSLLHPAVSKEICELYAAVGGSVVVPLDYELQRSENERLQWKFKSVTLFKQHGNKVIINENYVDSTGGLMLANLTLDDAGTYTGDVFKEAKSVHTKNWNMCVLAPVKKPVVNVTCLDQGSKVKFTCWTHQQRTDKQQMEKEGVRVSWSKNENVLKDINGVSFMMRADSVEKDSFTCNVSNFASFAVSDPVKQTCFVSMFPEHLFGVSIWIFVGGGGAIVLVLLIIIIVCITKNSRSRRRKKKEEAELRLDWANTELQQQQRQQQQQQRCHQQHGHSHALPHPHPHPHHKHQAHHHDQQQQQQQKKRDGPAGHTGHAGHTGPRKHCSKKPSHGAAKPKRTPKATQPEKDAASEQPPPLPNPRTKTLTRQGRDNTERVFSNLA